MTARLDFRFPGEVEGYLTEAEGRALYELAKATPDTCEVVELGSYKGRSTICLAQGHPLVWTVDHWLGETLDGGVGAVQFFDHIAGTYQPDFNANLKRYGVRERVCAVDSDTADAASRLSGRRIGLLFIDAAHDYPAVHRDFAAWEPLLAENGGVIAFHDSHFPGVAQVIEDAQQLGWRAFGATDSLTAMRKDQA